MSLPTASQLTDFDYLRDIAKQYHRNLQDDKSFPPLGADKALHILAKTLGLKNGHVLKAQLEGLGAATSEDQDRTAFYELTFNDAPMWDDALPITFLAETHGEAVWYLYSTFVKDRMVAGLAVGNFALSEMQEIITDTLSRFEMPVPDALSKETDSLEDEDSLRDALTEVMEDQVIEGWPLDAIVYLCEAYFDLRDAEKDLDSWYRIEKVLLESHTQCPDRLKV